MNAKIILKMKILEVHLISNYEAIFPESIKFTSNDGGYKINLIYITEFINDICNRLSELNVFNIKHDCTIDVSKFHLSTESIRDLYSDKLDNLLKCENTFKTESKLVGYGFKCGKTKPQRILYEKICNDNKNFDFIKTKKYSTLKKEKDQFVSEIDLKKKYKYFIDLEGHSYSTRSYAFLATKRVFFSSEHPTPMNWEKKYLKPWENYIPVKHDLSDLEEKYKVIESKPWLYKKIVENNISLMKTDLSKNNLMKNLINEIVKEIK